jgi:hypothetical protein
MLAEAMISIAVVGICLSLIVESLYQSYKALVLNEQYAQALVLMNNTMGQVLHNDAIAAAIEANGSFDAPFEQFHFDVQTQSLPEQEAFQEVSVRVQWPSGSRERQMVFNTLLLRHETP